MKLWVDDTRIPPEGWIWAKNYDQAVDMWLPEIVDASLDHDLGFEITDDMMVDWHQTNIPMQIGYNDLSKTGYDLVLWIVDNDAWPSNSLAIHSMNPVGAANMAGVVERYGPYTHREKCSYEDNGFVLYGVRYSREDS